MKRRGLSLVDVIFTASLLAVIFMVMMSLLPTAILSVKQTQHRLEANTLAGTILDECRSGAFENLLINYDVDPNSPFTVDLTTPGALGDVLRRTPRRNHYGVEYTPRIVLAKSPTSTLPRGMLAQVRVEVRWRERNQEFEVVRILQIAKVNRS
jgi:hypothetical protein